MHVLVTRDLVDFADHVRDFLASRPIEHNVLATVVDTLPATGGTDGGRSWERRCARRLGARCSPA